MTQKGALPHANVGTIGHVDHGKTTLTAAITALIAAKNMPNIHTLDSIEALKEKYLSLMSTHALSVEYKTEKRAYTHVDYPSDADDAKELSTDMPQLDAAILVVDAAHGIASETTEYIRLWSQKQIPGLVVFLNKVDLADAKAVELMEMQVRAALESCGFDETATPIIRGSALQALEAGMENAPLDDSRYRCIQDLMDALDNSI